MTEPEPEPEPNARHGLVVGVDGSPSSMVAVEWAAKDAALRGEPLTLLHVVMPPVTVSLPRVAVPAGFQRWQEDAGKVILDDAAALAEKAVTPRTVAIERRIVSGLPIVTLAEMSRHAVMVVVGCRGHGRLGRILGSVGLGLAQHGHGPVAVVHDDDPPLPESAFAPVVVGIDGSPTSEAATAQAFEEAARRGVDLVAVHACMDWSGSEHPFDERAALAAGGPEVLAQGIAGWQDRYPDVTVQRMVVTDHAAEHLVEQSRHCQLVVLGSRGLGGFAGLLLGSVSSAVVQSARAPVLVARDH
jgi:nucleotide-binding universal stress UspA family protein